MNDWKKLLKLHIRQLLGNLIIAIALIVVPFSMSHASMKDGTNQNDHKIIENEHPGKHHISNDNHTNKSADYHEAHDDTDCCSSICGGAFIINAHQVKCTAFSKPIKIANSSSLDQGEYVLPFRPPSI